MTMAKPSINIHDVGFLPGGMSLKYSSPVTITVLKNRIMETPKMVEEWCRRTQRPLHDLLMSNYAFLVDENADNSGYLVNFVKCRNRDLILEWLTENLGEPRSDGRWIMSELTQTYNPAFTICSEEDLVFFKMVWE